MSICGRGLADTCGRMYIYNMVYHPYPTTPEILTFGRGELKIIGRYSFFYTITKKNRIFVCCY